jgi:hypothetical protein
MNTNDIPNQINNQIDGLECIQQDTCLLGSLRSIFKFWNNELDLIESAVLGLGFGYSFRYGYYLGSKNEQCAIKFIPDIACFHMFLDLERLNEFADLVGIKIVENRAGSFDELISNIKSEIAQSRPVMLPVNNEYLPYLSDELRYVMGRYVVCYGWNDIENKVDVVDQFIPSNPPSKYMGSLSIESFISAIDMRPVAQDNDFSLWCFRATSKKSKIDYIELLKRSVENFPNNAVEEYAFSNSKVVYYSGINGMNKFKQDLVQIGEHGIQDDEKKWLLEAHYLLTSFSGPVKARKMYREFFDWIGREISVPDDLKEKLTKIYDTWTMVANVIFKAANNYDVKPLLRVTKLIDDLMIMEENAVKKILNL